MKRVALVTLLFLISAVPSEGCTNSVLPPEQRPFPSQPFTFSVLEPYSPTVAPGAWGNNLENPFAGSELAFRERALWNANDYFWSLNDMVTLREEGRVQHDYLAGIVYLVYDRRSVRYLGEQARGAAINPFDAIEFPTGLLDETARSLNDDERGVARRLVSEGHFFRSCLERPNQRNPEGHLVIPRTGERLRVEFKNLDATTGGDSLLDTILASLGGGGQAPYMIIEASRTRLTQAEVLRTVRRLIGVLQQRWDRGYPNRLHEIRVITGSVSRIFVLYPLDYIIQVMDRRESGGAGAALYRQ